MQPVTYRVAPGGAIFFVITILPPVGEAELGLVLEHGRWIAWWCGRRVGGGAVARA